MEHMALCSTPYLMIEGIKHKVTMMARERFENKHITLAIGAHLFHIPKAIANNSRMAIVPSRNGLNNCVHHGMPDEAKNVAVFEPRSSLGVVLCFLESLELLLLLLLPVLI